MVNSKVERISVLNVPVDILLPEDIEEVIKALYSDRKNHQIVLLSASDLLRARRAGEFRTMIMGAALVIPISLPIIKTARFLKRSVPVRYEPFEFIVSLLGILDHYGKSAYIFGGSKRNLGLADKNLRQTFPNLRIVGKHAGQFPKQVHVNIVHAIRKANPTLLLLGTGVPGREKWIPRNLKNFTEGLYLWCSDIIDVFAEKKKRSARSLFNRGYEWIYYLPRHPLRVFRFFSAFWFGILSLSYRIRGK